ncbi:F-box domain-containing protein [Favolaschia claudopus]|uniref:F-box domain-containing protein n=1 Tax=Favolaschia claudopus TaxID=2862362 RepID=A0AAW0ANC4_9AGAR
MLPSLEADRAIESISVLRAAKKPAEDRLHSHKYPVLTLPNEITSEIFQHYLPTYPEPPEFFEDPSPTTLTQICRQWRELALATPALWRAMDLRQISSSELAHLWLERSGCLPLSIRGTDAKGLFHTFSASIPHCARWEYLHLALDTSSNLKAIDAAMPLLRTLSLVINRRGRSASSPHRFQDVPLLRSVVLDCHSPTADVVLPWSQLTSLALRCNYSREIPSILRQMSNLVHCTLSMWDRYGNGPDSDLPLLRLETLVFKDDNETDVAVFKHLVTPALVCLELRESFLCFKGFGAAIAPHGGVVESLGAFISKSGCQLRELRITKASVPQEIYRSAFPSISTINCFNTAVPNSQ